LYTFTGSKAEALREVEIAMTTIIRLAPSDAESLGKREIMGRQATGFRVERASLVDDINDISIWEVWADPETAALVRVEIRHARSEGRVTLLDFDYDGASDLGEFRLEPPAGYVLVEESVGELGE
jgi:hypothetical protein